MPVRLMSHLAPAEWRAGKAFCIAYRSGQGEGAGSGGRDPRPGVGVDGGDDAVGLSGAGASGERCGLQHVLAV